MREEPHVNALCVECVIARGQHSNFLILLEFAEANRAFQQGHQGLIFTCFKIFSRESRRCFKHEGGYLGDGSGVEACVDGGLHRGGGCDAAPYENGSGRAVPKPLSIDVKHQNEEDNQEEHDDGSDHNSAVEGVM